MNKFSLILILVVLGAAIGWAQIGYEVMGPEGGSPAGVAVDTASGYLYVSSGPGGFLRKGPDQNQFEVMNNGIDFGNYFPIGSGVAIPPNDPGYVLTSYWSTIYYSEDYGETWQMSNFAAQSSLGFLNFLNDTMVFVTDYEQNFYKSTDKGKNWTFHSLNNQTNYITDMEMDPLHQRIYISNFDSVMYSDDFGDTWTVMPYVFPNYITEICAAQSSGKLYVSAQDSVFVTADNGQTWEKYKVGVKTYGLCEDADDPDVFYVGTIDMGVYRWDPAAQQLVHASNGLQEVTLGDTYFPIITELYVFGGSLYASGYQTGLFRSDDDGANWERIGMPVECVMQMEVPDTPDEKLFTGSIKGVQIYENQNWINSDLYGAGFGYEVDVLKFNPACPDTMYVGGKPADPGNSRLMTSVDGGKHWDMTFYSLGGGGITAVAANPNKPNFVFAGALDPGASFAGLYLSTNGGTTMDSWAPVPGTEGWSIGAIGISPMDFIVYVVTNLDGNVNVSVDGGQTFQYLSSLPGSNHYITGIYFDQLTGKIYLTGYGVYVSEDGGANWTDITPSQNAGLYFSSLLTDPVQADRLYLGSFGGGGVLLSDDGGQSWTSLGDQLPNRYVGDLAFSNDNNYLYIGTYGASVLKYNLLMTGIEPEQQAPQTFALSQNYPNPFNPSTTIDFRLATGGKVSLRVYNALGQEVATLVNGYKNAGEYRVEFSGAELPSGIYFYELQNGENRMTRKMILMK